MDEATSSFSRAHPLLLSWPLAPPNAAQKFTWTKCLQKRGFSLAHAGDQGEMRDWKKLHIASWTLWSFLANLKSKGRSGSGQIPYLHLLHVKDHMKSMLTPKRAWAQLRVSAMDSISQEQLCECVCRDNSIGVPKPGVQPNTTVSEVTLDEEWLT